MTTFTLDAALPDLYLCDEEAARYESWVLCLWNYPDLSDEGDPMYTVHSEQPLQIGTELEAEGVGWTIEAKGNGWIARPRAAVQ